MIDLGIRSVLKGPGFTLYAFRCGCRRTDHHDGPYAGLFYVSIIQLCPYDHVEELGGFHGPDAPERFVPDWLRGTWWKAAQEIDRRFFAPAATAARRAATLAFRRKLP